MKSTDYKCSVQWVLAIEYIHVTKWGAFPSSVEKSLVSLPVVSLHFPTYLPTAVNHCLLSVYTEKFSLCSYFMYMIHTTGTFLCLDSFAQYNVFEVHYRCHPWSFQLLRILGIRRKRVERVNTIDLKYLHRICFVVWLWTNNINLSAGCFDKINLNFLNIKWW